VEREKEEGGKRGGEQSFQDLSAREPPCGFDEKRGKKKKMGRKREA